MYYQITETREFYGPRTETSIVVNYLGEPAEFATLAAAKARIAELDAAPYTTAHNEIARPTYKIRHVGMADSDDSEAE